MVRLLLATLYSDGGFVLHPKSEVSENERVTTGRRERASMSVKRQASMAENCGGVC